MEPWHVAHLITVSLWGGLVLGEAVLELAARDEGAMRHVARVHFWMDVLVEVPLLAAVLLTGALLTARAWPPTALHAVKIGAGLVAVAVNVDCVVAVALRYRRREDAEILRRYGRRVRFAGLGVPFALVAAYIGLVHFALDLAPALRE